ncbi:MAG: hypothetical protein DI535_04175 [Citrobacter freundii]|nr:MAG: hypothetical protein DI535_04175 [Citrobacter freundii]
MLSILKDNVDNSLNGSFDYWLCLGRICNQRPFFIFLINDKEISKKSRELPWYSFIHQSSDTSSPMELLDISDFDHAKKSNFLFPVGPQETVDNPSLQIAGSTAKTTAKPSQLITVHPLNTDAAKLSLDASGKKLTIDAAPDQDFLDIRLTYSAQGQTYSSNLRFFFHTEDTLFFESWLDFGSEASQYGILDSSSNVTKVVHGDIFQSFKKMYGHTGVNDNDFFQRDGGGNNLIKTRIYYSENNLGKHDNILQASTFTDNDVLLYLKRITASPGNPGDYQLLLPYLKLLLSQSESAHVSINSPDTGRYNLGLRKTLLKLTAAILCSYCRVLIGEICGDNPGKKVLTSIHILFPNTLSQFTITYILNELHYNLINLSASEKPSNFKGFELNALPESDATYLSDLSREENLKDKSIVLCIDCGKGTTDMGVYYYNKPKAFRLMRTGLPVAGNFLTFAAGLGILHSYTLKYAPNFIEKGKIKNSLMEKFLKEIRNGYIQSENFWNYIERAKIRMSRYSFDELDRFMLPEFAAVLNTRDESLFAENLIAAISADAFYNTDSTPTEGAVAFTPYYTNHLLRAFFECLYTPLERLNTHHRDYGLSGFSISQIKLSGRGMLFNPFRSFLKSELIRRSVAKESSFSDPGINDPISWKSASINGVGNIGMLKSNNGILDTALINFTGSFKSFNNGFDAGSFDFIQRSDKWTFRFDHPIICGSHKLKKPQNGVQLDKKEYRLWFDGLQYRFSHKQNGNYTPKENFKYEPEHEMKNDHTKSFTLISQFPNVNDNDISRIVHYLDEIDN